MRCNLWLHVRRQGAVAMAVAALILAGCMSAPADESDPNSNPGVFQSGEEGDPQPGGKKAPPPAWEFALVANATIRPGVRIDGGQGVPIADPPNWCTSNFVFLDKNGSAYLGMAAHCERRLGAEVIVEGAQHPGTVVYNSFATMDEVSEPDGHIRFANDFAVVALHEDDYARLNPTVLHWGGPTAVANSSLLEVGAGLRTYGNTPLRPGPSDLDAREGSLIVTEPWWGAASWDGSPGVAGDSGSAVLTSDGEAVGVVTRFNIASESPINPDERAGPTGSNNLVYLDMALDYARVHAGMDLYLAVEGMAGPPGASQ